MNVSFRGRWSSRGFVSVEAFWSWSSREPVLKEFSRQWLGHRGSVLSRKMQRNE